MTLLNLREHPLARAEYLDAITWYEDRRSGLGTQLADALDDGVDSVRAWPTAAPPFRGRKRVPLIRQRGVGTFPYTILYSHRADEVFVVAYAHKKRRPGYWRSRLNE